ncbi:hypothetical protein VNO77_03444 [Canavalia gladiata]|uniref:Uncharacterized protein n=1 Tax=Canavalia gladiata TaxID=3824 RepID=A0AAN9N156_CANGL
MLTNILGERISISKEFLSKVLKCNGEGKKFTPKWETIFMKHREEYKREEEESDQVFFFLEGASETCSRIDLQILSTFLRVLDSWVLF